MKLKHIWVSSSVISATVAVLIAANPFFNVYRPAPQSTINTPQIRFPKVPPNPLDEYDEKMAKIAPPHADDKMIFIPSDDVEYK